MNDANDLPRIPPHPTSKGLSKSLGTWSGALFYTVLLAAALMATFILYSIAFAFGFFSPSYAFFYAAFALTPLIPFAMGILAGKGAWLLGLVYALVFLFVGMPLALFIKYNSYIWSLGSDFKYGYIAIPVVLILSPLLAWAGSALLRSGRLKPFTLDRPYLSVVPIVGIVVLTAIIIPFTQAPGFGAGKTFVSKKYKFKIEVPAGWSSPVADDYSRRQETGPPLVIYDLDYDDLNRQHYSIGESGNYVTMKVAVFDHIPYTNESLQGLSAGQVYDRVSNALTELYRVEHSTYPVYSTDDKREVVVDGVDGISFVYFDFGPQEDGYQSDVFVYSKPYLYRISFRFLCPVELQHEIYNQMLDSFQFID